VADPVWICRPTATAKKVNPEEEQGRADSDDASPRFGGRARCRQRVFHPPEDKRQNNYKKREHGSEFIDEVGRQCRGNGDAGEIALDEPYDSHGETSRSTGCLTAGGTR
jgi:hypothetical protein